MRTRIGRRVAAPVAAGLALTLVLAACGGKDEPADQSDDSATGELVIWSDPNRAQVLNQFKEQIETDLGITLVIEEIAKDQQTTFVTASQQGAGPDVMVGAHDWIGNLVRNGAIDPVQLTEAQLAAFPQIAIDAVTFDGQATGCRTRSRTSR